MLDLEQQDLETVLKILKLFIPQGVVYAYGSRVSGRSHSGSDLDLVIINPSSKRCDISDIRVAFQESDLPMSVDIFYWDDIPDSFKEEISNHKLKIYG